ncbi:MAG: GNAT family N-acetyltransferase [Candidatus Altiarchaeota archaeon]|nr:GNAT family N-acetyltransferase [Candidatus Altiarchaeota archaeon]
MNVIRHVARDDITGMRGILEHTSEFSSRDVECCLECLHECVGGVEPTYKFICAVEDDGLTGFACYDTDTLADGVFEVYWVVVAPHKRKNGVGRMLLESIESEAKKENARMIAIETESGPNYENARRLYEKCGFVSEAVLKDFYHKGEDKLIYVKRIG